jgi:hypothetical protein
MTSPELSVGIPGYNREKLLRRAPDILLGKTRCGQLTIEEYEDKRRLIGSKPSQRFMPLVNNIGLCHQHQGVLCHQHQGVLRSAHLGRIPCTPLAFSGKAPLYRLVLNGSIGRC